MAMHESLTSDSLLVPQDPYVTWGLLVSRDRYERSPILPSIRNKQHRCFLARNAIFHSLQFLKIGAGARVLVPAFICKTVIEPIVAAGAKVDFYEVDRSCHADFADLETKIERDTAAVLAVHYYGFPQKIEQFRDVCDRHRLYLIEDCAHVLRGYIGDRLMGTFGDVSIFSWRKFLPVYDGGVLMLNDTGCNAQISWANESALFTLKVLINLVERALKQSRMNLVKRTYRVLQTAKQQLRHRLIGESIDRAQNLSIDSNNPMFDPSVADVPMSRLSQWVMSHSNVDAIIARRRQNYLYLEEKLTSIPGVTLFANGLPAGVCPWMLPCFLDDMPNAHVPLRQRGVPASSWSGVVPPDLSRDKFPGAKFLYEHLVCLPIHQNLQEKDLDAMVEMVRLVRDSHVGFAPDGERAVA
jgi:dTDP-4-amino-4,6-dideoxygalactose transaminase